jgi:hypothetical protein
MFAWPAQVVLATNQIGFTQNVHRALANYRNPSEEFAAMHAKIVAQLSDLAGLLRGSTLTPHQRSTATALLVNEVFPFNFILYFFFYSFSFSYIFFFLLIYFLISFYLSSSF